MFSLGSLHFDARGLDHLGPLFDLVGNEFSEFGGCQGHRLKAQANKARLHIGFGDDGIDLLVELFDNLRGCALRRTDAVPTAGLVARQKFITVGRSGSISKRAALVTARARNWPVLMYSI